MPCDLTAKLIPILDVFRFGSGNPRFRGRRGLLTRWLCGMRCQSAAKREKEDAADFKIHLSLPPV
jgi:hypothetical protein